MMFQLRPHLMSPAEDPPAGAGGEDAKTNDLINKALTAFARRDLPKILEGTIKQTIQEVTPSITEAVIDQLSQLVPTDEELEAMGEGNMGDQPPDDGTGEKPPMSSPAPGGNAPPAPGAGGVGGQTRLTENPEINALLLQLRRENQRLQSQMDELVQRNEEAEQAAELADRGAQIQAALNAYPFANERARDVVFQYIAGVVERNPEDGSLIANGLPLSEYVSEQLTELPGLLAARSVGGTGAKPGKPGATGPTMEMIKPGMSPEDRQSVVSTAIPLLQAQLGS